MSFPKPNLTTQRQRARRRQRAYTEARKAHLAANPNCERCGGTATQVHHVKGRRGNLLTDESNFLSVCLGCHAWIHAHPMEAMERGWLGGRNQ